MDSGMYGGGKLLNEVLAQEGKFMRKYYEAD
jgi:hypothetical protein